LIKKREQKMIKQDNILREYKSVILYIVVFIGLLFTKAYSYILFHSFSELFSIIIAFGIFMIAWNSRQYMENDSLLYLGIAFYFIGTIDLFHTLAYKGMGVFKGYDANLPTQLWIAGRYLQAVSFLLSFLFIKRKLNTNAIFSFYLILTAIIITSIFYLNIFPNCFIEGKGLTFFKIISEYIISFLLILALYLLLKNSQLIDTNALHLIAVSIIFTIASEMSFTLYTDVYGISNMIGHYLKIVSYYLLYKAIIENGIIKPHDLLHKNMDKLKDALDNIKTLKGMLPICSNCKKIRDDEGYWHNIEKYIYDHSEAELSHSICPDCYKKLYPEFYQLNELKEKFKKGEISKEEYEEAKQNIHHK
jgi:hypothetical protein